MEVEGDPRVVLGTLNAEECSFHLRGNLWLLETRTPAHLNYY